jgi:hypothetical protein
MQQCIFGSKLPNRLKEAKHLWSLIRGSILWVVWIDKNAICFSQEVWPQIRVEKTIWEAILDHGRTAWYRTKCLIKQYPNDTGKFLDRFDQEWCRSFTFAQRRDMTVTWNCRKPRMGTLN